MLAVFTECNLCLREGDDALHILLSLARGFALHELMNSFLHTYCYDETYERSLDIFIAGLRVAGGSAEGPDFIWRTRHDSNV